jgi:hypothetical protein
MNESAPRPKPRRIRQIAVEVCALFQQEIDTLQLGLTEEEVEPYLERRRQIHELQTELETLRRRPS